MFEHNTQSSLTCQSMIFLLVTVMWNETQCCGNSYGSNCNTIIKQACFVELVLWDVKRKSKRRHPSYIFLGGTTYQVPFPIEKAEAEFRAMKMMRDICRQKAAHGETHLKDILANELLAASQNEGLTIQAKQELHKTCEANRAYAHYRS
ncbi:hypothetical protein Y032_0026g1404 [Ancylostoma ceylanicum]|uniref:Small ribosomal subunit protein uS7 domain-containing protein n=1 Tax=Ancylostoma ceylanicum TaxID=53326 RepID=A0A016UVM8_9BILA|nr:hypothetical protein Y032_0026g1404 [Ancylostoma ceylanicum]